MKNFLTREHSSLRKRTSRNHFGFKVKTMGFIACLALFFSCSSEENPVDPIDNTPRLNKSDSLAMVNIYKAAFSTGAHMPQWVLYISYPIGSIAMVLGYLRITPPKVKKIWTDTVEKTEFDLINEGVIE